MIRTRTELRIIATPPHRRNATNEEYDRLFDMGIDTMPFSEVYPPGLIILHTASIRDCLRPAYVYAVVNDLDWLDWYSLNPPILRVSHSPLAGILGDWEHPDMTRTMIISEPELPRYHVLTSNESGSEMTIHHLMNP